MKKYIIYLVLTSLLLNSCKQDGRTEQDKTKKTSTAVEHIPKSEAVVLNDSAVNFLSQTMMFQDSLNADLHKKALELLNESLQLDSLYDLAYSNKVDVLKKMGRYEEAINTLKHASVLIDNYAEAFTVQGFLYEKLGKIDSAELMYNIALKTYQNRLDNNPENINDLINVAFIVIFIQDKNSALYEMDDIINNTNSQQAKDFREVIKNFDREKFIKEY